MPREYGSVKADLQEIIQTWKDALQDSKLTPAEFFHAFSVSLNGLQGLIRDVAGDDAAYATLRSDTSDLIDQYILPIDLPGVGPFLENNFVDPGIRRTALASMDGFRKYIQSTT